MRRDALTGANIHITWIVGPFHVKNGPFLRALVMLIVRHQFFSGSDAVCMSI